MHTSASHNPASHPLARGHAPEPALDGRNRQLTGHRLERERVIASLLSRSHADTPTQRRWA